MSTVYHPVKEITKKKQTWRLAVILDDMWTVYKGEEEDHIELLLRDVNGDTIQALIHRNDVDEWKSKLKEGTTYCARNFRVTDNDYQFKMSDHKFKLTFLGATRVTELQIPDMPISLFKFKDFAEILKGTYRKDLLVDAIGVVVDIGKCVHASGPKKGNVAFKLQDLSDNTLDCTLWDALSVQFLDAYNNRNDFGPVVVIFKHARIKEAQGQYPIQFTNVWNGTKLLVNDNIAEIAAFKSSLPKDFQFASQNTTMSASTQYYTQGSQGSQYNSDDLFVKNALAVRLRSMKQLKRDTICVTVVTMSQILVGPGGWFFRSCRQCNKKCDGLEPPFVCKDNHETNDPIVKYKLDVEMDDGDDTMKFVFWDNTLDELTGITAAALLADMEKNGQSDPRDYPDVLEELMDRTFAFRVKWQYSWKHCSVINCSSNQELIAKIQDQLPTIETSNQEINSASPTANVSQVNIIYPTADMTPGVSQDVANSDSIPHQTFTREDISKFNLLDDAILSTPNASACASATASAETESTPSMNKCASAKRTARQKSYDDRLDSQLSSTKAVKNIKKEK